MTQPPPEPTPQSTPLSWEGEVAYPSSGDYAYRPGWVLVLGATVDGRLRPEVEAILNGDLFGDDAVVTDQVAGYSLIRVNPEADVPQMVAELRAEGFDAQVEHMMFADRAGGPLSADGFEGNPLSGNPLSGSDAGLIRSIVLTRMVRFSRSAQL